MSQRIKTAAAFFYGKSIAPQDLYEISDVGVELFVPYKIAPNQIPSVKRHETPSKFGMPADMTKLAEYIRRAPVPVKKL